MLTNLILEEKYSLNSQTSLHISQDTNSRSRSDIESKWTAKPIQKTNLLSCKELSNKDKNKIHEDTEKIDKNVGHKTNLKRWGKHKHNCYPMLTNNTHTKNKKINSKRKHSRRMGSQNIQRQCGTKKLKSSGASLHAPQAQSPFVLTVLWGLGKTQMWEDVLTTMSIKITVFWDMAPCNLVDRYQCFGKTLCLHLQDRTEENYQPSHIGALTLPTK